MFSSKGAPAYSITNSSLTVQILSFSLLISSSFCSTPLSLRLGSSMNEQADRHLFEIWVDEVEIYDIGRLLGLRVGGVSVGDVPFDGAGIRPAT